MRRQVVAAEFARLNNQHQYSDDYEQDAEQHQSAFNDYDYRANHAVHHAPRRRIEQGVPYSEQ